MKSKAAVSIVASLMVVGGLLTVPNYLQCSEETVNEVYNANGVYVHLYRGGETQTTQWVVLGTTNNALRVIVDSGNGNRSYTPTPGCSTVRNDAPFTVQIQRKWLGLVYAPYKTLTFTHATSIPPLFDVQNAVVYKADCESALSAQ